MCPWGTTITCSPLPWSVKAKSFQPASEPGHICCPGSAVARGWRRQPQGRRGEPRARQSAEEQCWMWAEAGPSRWPGGRPDLGRAVLQELNCGIMSLLSDTAFEAHGAVTSWTCFPSELRQGNLQVHRQLKCVSPLITNPSPLSHSPSFHAITLLFKDPNPSCTWFPGAPACMSF